MAWANTGTVIEQRCVSGRLHRLRLAWESDGAVGAILNLAEPLFGTLHRFETSRPVGAFPYSVRLHDEFGADVLNAQGVSLMSSLLIKTLRVLLDGSDLPRPIAVGGRHVFRISAAAGHGVFSLWYWPTMDPRLERRFIF